MIPPSSVLSRVLVAQPVTPAVGDRYLIPTAATGAAWAGMDGRVGVYTAAGWRFAILPAGRFIYVEDETAFYHRNVAGIWTAGVGSIAGIPTSGALVNSKTAGLTANGSFGSGGSGNYTYSYVTAPTTSQVYFEDLRTLTYTAKAPGNKLIFHYVLEDTSGGITTGVVALALFQDSGANAVDWRFLETSTANKLYGTFQFGISAPDALSHVYKVRIVNISSGAFGAPNSRLFRVEEYVQ